MAKKKEAVGYQLAYFTPVELRIVKKSFERFNELFGDDPETEEFSPVTMHFYRIRNQLKYNHLYNFTEEAIEAIVDALSTWGSGYQIHWAQEAKWSEQDLITLQNLQILFRAYQSPEYRRMKPKN